MLSTVASLPIVSVPSIVEARSSSPAGDVRLIELAQEILELRPSYNEATDRQIELEELYRDNRPSRPRELAWRMSDPVGHEMERVEDDACGRPRGKLWCREEAIDALREKPLVRYEFVGTDEQWADDSNHVFGPDHTPANPSVWQQRPDLRSQPRADELVRALDTWREQKAAYRRELDIDRSNELVDQLYERLCSLEEEVFQLRATTVDGIKAKAMILFRGEWRNDATDQLRGIGYTAERLIFSILADLGEGAYPKTSDEEEEEQIERERLELTEA